jgi:hypothetical protein
LYPFWGADIVDTAPVKGVEFFAEMSTAATTVTVSDTKGHHDTLVRNPLMSTLLAGSLVKIPFPAAVSDSTHPALTVSFDNNAMEDLWLAITWGGK